MSGNPPTPKMPLSTSNVANVPRAAAPIHPDADTSFLEMVLDAHEATPARGIRVDQIRAFLRMRYQVPEAVIEQILLPTIEFAVEAEMLLKVGGRKSLPQSWTTRPNPSFVLKLLRRVRLEARAVLAAAAAAAEGTTGGLKRTAGGEQQTSTGGSGGKKARI
ncbi:uncharacterized protein LOC6034403 [Culex quinquefasciatus]|uniref:uncharacterized protein LOC6034403 n=1 Tax=Culex quinquefasciatus TaxID=7176 RepID=UPI0018E3DCA7|nr:uncharacterized protein LOC6034403 [Culex quinquefasciatus]